MGDAPPSPGSSPDVQQSLQELASLLVLLHDFYLRAPVGREVGQALLRLVCDMGLQDVVSVLDAEKLRRQVMHGSDVMGYEDFYDWLRLLSRLAFGVQEADPKRALHLLLTEHIVPCTSGMDSYQPSRDFPTIVQSFDRLTDRALKLFAEYSNFLTCWFYDILTPGDSGSRGHQGSTLWQLICSAPRQTALAEEVIKALTTAGLVPKIVSANELESIVLICAEGEDSVSFFSFLYILELIADRVDVDDFYSVDVDLARESRPLLVLRVVLESLFNTHLASRMQLVAMQAPKSYDPAKLRLAALVWWLFDAKFSLFTDQNIGTLCAVVMKALSQFAAADEGPERLPFVMLSLLQKMAGDDIAPDPSTPAAFSDPAADYSLFHLAANLPCLFLSPGLAAAETFLCFCEETCARWMAAERVIASVLESLSATSCNPMYMPTSPLLLHYAGFLETEVDVSAAEFQEFCRARLSPAFSEDRFLCTREAVQVCLYALAHQVCARRGLLEVGADWRKGANIVFTLFVDLITRQPPTALQSVRKAKESIRAMMSQAVSVLDPPSDARCFPSRPQPVAVEAPPADPAPPKVKYSIFDITVLLMHYPAVGFSLNPWEVAALAARLEDESSMHALDESKDPGPNLTTLLRAFGTKYEVTVAELSGFFAAFYSANERAEQLLQSAVLRLLCADNILRLLSLNEDLLQWEFSRCYSSYSNGPDPFTAELLVPVLSCGTNPAVLPLVSYSKAKAWAAQLTPLPEKDIERLFALSSSLSGKFTGWLTYSTFIIFAVRCFTANEVDEEAKVLSQLRSMLRRFSTGLTAAQQALQLRVLVPLFHSAPAMEVDVAFKRKALENAMAAFHRHVAAAAAVPVLKTSPPMAASPKSLAAASAGPTMLPPRPPVVLWDAARFVNFVHFLGLAEHLDIPMDCLWAVFGLHLKQLNLMDLTEASVAPLPIKVDPDKCADLLGLLCLMITDLAFHHPALDIPAITDAQIYHTGVVPLLAAAVDGRPPRSRADEGWLLEDLLRYGGHEAMLAFSDAKSFLRAAYRALCVTSEQGFVCPHIALAGQLRSAPPAEMTINVAVSFLSCAQLLSAQEAARELRRALHRRPRPLCFPRGQLEATSWGASMPVSDPPAGKAPALAVTISFAELEEAVWRCALALWIKSGAAQASQDVLSSRTTPETAALTADGSAVHGLELYRKEVVKVLRATAGKRTGRPRWGVDFVRPFVALLQAHLSLKNSDRLVVGLHGLSWMQVITRPDDGPGTPEPRSGPPQPDTPLTHSALSSLLLDKLDHRVADPAARVQTDGGGGGARRFASSAPRSFVPQVEDEERSVSSRESKVFRFDMDETRGSLAGFAYSKLFSDAKEALWPIFATYCSCGDSVDPGKLSGPNLFTLLSKLGVLTDQTVLTDVGILFYQISLRSLSISPVSTVKALQSARREDAAATDAPALSFEEFLIFLYLFSVTRYEGSLRRLQDLPWPKPASSTGRARSRATAGHWFQYWQEQMSMSASFQRLLTDCIMPIVMKQTLLAFPEDARLRDRFVCVYSLEALLAMESCEGRMQGFFAAQLASRDDTLARILQALRRVRLVPAVITEAHVLDLVKDVMPEHAGKERAAAALLFPQFEWLLSVVCFQAVETALQQSGVQMDAERMPELLADVITAVSSGLLEGAAAR